MERILLRTAALVLLACSPSLAQVTIENPKNLEVSPARVNLVFSMTCNIIAKEFHMRDSSKLEFPLTLVLGEPNEHYTADDNKGVYTIYLDDWNEAHFASSTLALVVHHLVSIVRQRELVREILLRSNRIAPVSSRELRKRN